MENGLQYEILFAGREKAKFLILANRVLYEEFAAWTRGDSKVRGYQVDDRTIINFEQVQMMTVEKEQKLDRTI